MKLVPPVSGLRRFWIITLAIGVVGLGSAALATAAIAQTYDCDQLRQILSAPTRADPSRSAQFARAAQRQRVELERTQAYSDQIGCNTGPLSIFGDDPPAQCDTIRAQIGRMSNNLSALQSQIEELQGADPSRNAALSSQYQTYCNTESAPFNGYDNDQGRGNDNAIRPGFDDADPSQAEDSGRPRSGKAVCVKTCDGGFFPLSYSSAQHDLSGLQDLCTALCPNTEAKLYTTSDTDNIGAAVSADGRAYSDLPSAFKFQKSFDSTCTCKPPNRSWVEALAEAERLLDKSENNDVTVTAKMSDDMARPGSDRPVPVKQKARKLSKKAMLDLQAAAEGTLGAVGAQAPTASKDSAGIVSDMSPSEHVVRSGEGAVKTVPGPDGSKRRVRIIGLAP